MPTQIENIKFYTVQEIASILQVTPQTIRTYIKQDKIRAQRIGRPLLITESSLKEFLNNN